jgi:membrane protein
VTGPLRRIVAIIRVAAKEFVVDRGLRLAAALSYYAVFSLVPLLFLVVAVAGFLLGDPGAVRDLVDRVTEVAGADVGSTVESLLETVRSERGGTLSIGLGLAAFTGSTIFQQLQGVLGAIFHVPQEQRRRGIVGWLVRRAIGMGAVLVLAVLAFTPIIAVGAIEWIVDLLPDSLNPLRPVLRLGVPAVSVLMLMAVVGLVFQALTAVEIPWKAAVRGGATTALMGLTASLLVGLYLNRAGATGTLGALGGVAILLFFSYLLWIVLVFGAEVTKVYGDYLEHGDIAMPSEREDTPSIRPAARPVPATHHVGDGGNGPRRDVAGFIAGAAIGWLIGRRR